MRIPLTVFLLPPVLVIVFLCQGCAPADRVAATPRPESNKPVFGSTTSNTGLDASSDTKPVVGDLDVSFLRNDHFACFVADAQAFVQHPDLSQIPWQDLSDALAESIGSEAGQLELIQRVWILLDGEYLQIIPDLSGRPSTSPVVLVVDYQEDLDLDRLQVPNRSEQSAGEEAEPESDVADIDIQALSPRRLAIGAGPAVAKLTKDGQSPRLVSAMKQLDLESEFTGIVLIGPVRSTLQSLFDIAAGMSEEAKRLADLPRDLQKIETALRLDSAEDFFELNIALDDPKLVKELAGMMSNALEGSSGLGAMAAMNGTSMDAANQLPPQIVQMKSTEALMNLGREIQEKNLLSVRNNDSLLQIKLARPSRTAEVLDSMIADTRNQLELGRRTKNLNRIARALQDYQDKYGSLPSVNAFVDPQGDHPQQFSWRVALLPMLGYRQLYDRFDFSQPWDSQQNLEVASDIPQEFRWKLDSNQSVFHLYSGPTGVHADPASFPDTSSIQDRKIWTAIVVEGSDSTASIWTKPEAIDVASPTINTFGAPDENGILMIDATFNVRGLRRNTDKLRAVLSAAGDEKLSRKDFFRMQ